nr:MAG TPA: hypothetical protein [Caudoviricetes sp.]
MLVIYSISKRNSQKSTPQNKKSSMTAKNLHSSTLKRS